MSEGSRDERLAALRENPRVSVLIIGGGVNGIGLMRDLALQGVDTLLVDKSDFVAGASSKSSRMIHGGLRYLENREFGLVSESLRERDRLLEGAAHYVTPLRTTIPLFSWLAGLLRSPLVFLGLPVKPGGRGALVVHFGLWFYDLVTRRRRKTPRHFLSSRSTSLRDVPGLNPDIVATATYWDAWITQAERLCIEMILDAGKACPDCRALNYVRPVGLDDGRVLLRDELSGETFPVLPRLVVNATGAWVDRTNASLGLETHLMGGTKGSHLVVDHRELFDALGGRMVYYEHPDGRVCIVFPFLDRVIMGSTDIPIDEPDDAFCDEDEVDYMLGTLRGVFPGLRLGRSDCVYKFCGVRPLPAASTDTPGRVSRGHAVVETEPSSGRPFAVLSLVGGKWTTFRALAEETADRVLARLERSRVTSTAEVRIGGGAGFPRGDDEKRTWIERVAEGSRVAASRVEVLLGRYGTRCEEYIAGFEGRGETPLRSLPEYSVEEVTAIAARESVVHLDDLVCRRSLIALLGHAKDVALEELAEILGRRLGWDAEQREAEVRRTREIVAL